MATSGLKGTSSLRNPNSLVRRKARGSANQKQTAAGGRAGPVVRRSRK